ncbi:MULTISPECIES: hypothetical protein [unclassified Nocardioides]|uniref:hypothetical protein n=1 Tax=unclassified Nocardioides TaxID=2615069 RepID=UPI0000571523|nr:MULTISPECIES: hypothetical protein [unclassified Nocardioides]ABL80288.1 hypothetical protein Noca_0763 [Nocardioides sp. JS614]
MSTEAFADRATAPGSDGGEHLHWETALDRLELDVLLAERMLADPARTDRLTHDPWDEPTLFGPIPADLVERALALRDRQAQVEAQLRQAAGTVGRQHRFAERVDRATGRGHGYPVYLDIDA